MRATCISAVVMRMTTRRGGLGTAEHPDARHIARRVVGLRVVTLRCVPAKHRAAPLADRHRNQDDGDQRDREHNPERDPRAHTHLVLSRPRPEVRRYWPALTRLMPVSAGVAVLRG